MASEARKCDGCKRVVVSVVPVSLFVSGRILTERRLCAGCRCYAVDEFGKAAAPWLLSPHGEKEAVAARSVR